MFLHNIIKILYISLGYLPNFPYHLISDAEMFDAFLKSGGYFEDCYPCPDPALRTPYNELKVAIVERIQAYQNGSLKKLPDWVYSYMLMRPITYSSDEANIAYLYELTGVTPPSTLAEFSPELAVACYRTSKEWIRKLPSRYADRPPTLFGETHVTKSLRLNQANILVEPEGIV